MARRSKERKYKILCIALAIVAISLGIYIALTPILPKKMPPIFALPQLSTAGFEKVQNVNVEIFENEGSVTLRTNCYALTAGVEATQAASIQNALLNRTSERPNAHDLVKDVFSPRALDIEVLMVKITELKGNAYFARILLRQENTYLDFEVRPSDGIAIALRTKSPIYINRSLLMEKGKYIC